MGKSVRLNKVANVAGLTPKSFCRFFRANTGKTFMEYFNALRIEETCRLLLETNNSVTDIAFRVGFNNLSNFNRRFRKLKGMSPREFRAKSIDLRQSRQNVSMPRQPVYA